MKELDHRTNNGLDVRLLWQSATNEVFVQVNDERTAAAFTLSVAPDEAHDAFMHPYAYASSGVESELVPA
jgi:threonine aldolase